MFSLDDKFDSLLLMLSGMRLMRFGRRLPCVVVCVHIEVCLFSCMVYVLWSLSAL